ncbi:MAG TPA: hypothetical protein VK604_01550 [Bryobacteraceae bacterium]|nr:hypothetical protein [Bryobacteraceae bacterium]
MSLVLTFAPVAVLAPMLILGYPVLTRLLKGCRIEEINAEWLENFSAALYYPMEGLLSDEDFTFLSRQPGFDASLYRKLRRDRLRIFRQYFLRLIRDFNRLHSVGRALLAETKEDHSELILKMILLKARFSLSVLCVEANYWWCFVRFRPLVVRSLISSLEEMNAHLHSLGRVPAPSSVP